MNQSDAVRMSVDIPSGICATTGNVLGTAVRADYTVTIQETKVGLVLDPGRSYAGICVSAVSYTHLDVYKRQDRDRLTRS